MQSGSAAFTTKKEKKKKEKRKKRKHARKKEQRKRKNNSKNSKKDLIFCPQQEGAIQEHTYISVVVVSVRQGPGERVVVAISDDLTRGRVYNQPTRGSLQQQLGRRKGER